MKVSLLSNVMNILLIVIIKAVNSISYLINNTRKMEIRVVVV